MVYCHGYGISEIHVAIVDIIIQLDSLFFFKIIKDIKTQIINTSYKMVLLVCIMRINNCEAVIFMVQTILYKSENNGLDLE